MLTLHTDSQKAAPKHISVKNICKLILQGIFVTHSSPYQTSVNTYCQTYMVLEILTPSSFSAHFNHFYRVFLAKVFCKRYAFISWPSFGFGFGFLGVSVNWTTGRVGNSNRNFLFFASTLRKLVCQAKPSIKCRHTPNDIYATVKFSIWAKLKGERDI